MTVPRRYFFCGSLMFLFCLFLLCLCARLFICALWSPAWKGLTSWLSFVVSNCEFVTFPLVSWARYGTWLYRFLIFAPLLTLHSYLIQSLGSVKTMFASFKVLQKYFYSEWMRHVPAYLVCDFWDNHMNLCSCQCIRLECLCKIWSG